MKLDPTKPIDLLKIEAEFDPNEPEVEVYTLNVVFKGELSKKMELVLSALNQGVFSSAEKALAALSKHFKDCGFDGVIEGEAHTDEDGNVRLVVVDIDPVLFMVEHHILNSLDEIDGFTELTQKITSKLPPLPAMPNNNRNLKH